MSFKTPPEFLVRIEKLVAGGEAMGHFEGRAVFVHGALPGELASVFPMKIRKGVVQAGLARIVEPSPARRPEREAHFLSCSPWSVMPEATQREEKIRTTTWMWRHLGGSPPTESEPRFHASPTSWAYRNKIEFSFDREGEISFRQRGSHFRTSAAPEGCCLAHEGIDRAAVEIASALRAGKVDPAKLKTLTVRASFASGDVIASLAVRDPDFQVGNADLRSLREVAQTLRGFEIIYSRPESPATTRDRVLFQTGELSLVETLAGTELEYPIDGFFQVNPPAAELLIGRLRELLRSRRPEGAEGDSKDLARAESEGAWRPDLSTSLRSARDDGEKGGRLVDLYAGVGTLGLALAGDFAEVHAVEVVPSAVRLSGRNAVRNAVRNFTAECLESEKADLPRVLAAADVLLVDPPRAGLHPRVVSAIREHGPETLVYVSCNPATQARDWAELRKSYDAEAWELFDFYPQTPHVESVILARRKR